MDRELTNDELEGTEIGKIINRIGCFIDESLERGYLKDCEMYYPLICDEEPLELANEVLHTNAEYMYYIPLLGKKASLLDNCEVLTKMIKVLAEDYEGHILRDHKKITHINCMSFADENKDTAHYNILILIKCDIDTESNLIN